MGVEGGCSQCSSSTPGRKRRSFQMSVKDCSGSSSLSESGIQLY